MQNGQETSVAAVNHWIDDLLADQQHFMVPLEAQHGLRWATGDCREGGRLQLGNIGLDVN